MSGIFKKKVPLLKTGSEISVMLRLQNKKAQRNGGSNGPSITFLKGGMYG